MFFAALAAALWQAPVRAQPVAVFDSESGRPLGFPGSPGRSFIGEAFNLAPTGSPVLITQMDTFLVSATATAYNDIQLRVQFWNTASNATSGAGPVFSNPAGGPLVFDFGAFTTAAATAYTINGLTFASPVLLDGTTNLGMTMNWQGDTGTGLANTDNLTASVGVAPTAAGSVTVGGGNGYYRNASGETDFNFAGTDGRSLGGSSTANPSADAFRLYVAAPEPGSTALCGFAAAAAAGLWRRRRTG
jgi:hypothetical protein